MVQEMWLIKANGEKKESVKSTLSSFLIHVCNARGEDSFDLWNPPGSSVH